MQMEKQYKGWGYEMIKLNNNEFKKIAHLVKSQDELSVFSVINGENPGDIYVNNADE